jgi:hypothetical protein
VTYGKRKRAKEKGGELRNEGSREGDLRRYDRRSDKAEEERRRKKVSTMKFTRIGDFRRASKILPYFFWVVVFAVFVDTILTEDTVGEKIWNLAYECLVFAGLYAVLRFLIYAFKEG